MSEKINHGNVYVREVNSISDLLDKLNADFKIKALRYPNEKEKV